MINPPPSQETPSRQRLVWDTPIYMVMSSISKEFGGMTTAFLKRAQAFKDHGHNDVTLLTTQPENGINLDQVKNRLVSQGLIPPLLPIRNMWEDLRKMSDADLSHMQNKVASKDIFADPIVKHADGWEAYRYSTDNEILQIDRFRKDGSRFASDRRDANKLGVPGGRKVTLYSRQGIPVAQWRKMSHLVEAWLDEITKERLSCLIIDSNFIANLLNNYRRRHLVMGRVIHSHHLGHQKSDKYALAKQHMPAMVNHDSLDFIVLLTKQQQADMHNAGLVSCNTYVIPNINSHLVTDDWKTKRDPLQGVVVARLSSGKRIEHAIEAARLLHDQGIKIKIDIYGQGPEQEKLSKLIKTKNLNSYINLRGHTSSAATVFENASFSLLTSRREGQGMVLIESMAAGCIPVSYDVEYGPSEIITDKKNGVLVPADDISKLAVAIGHIASLEESSLKKLRRRAIARAHDFDKHQISSQWMTVLQNAIDTKKFYNKMPGEAFIKALKRVGPGWNLEFYVSGIPKEIQKNLLDAKLLWISREQSQFQRQPLTLLTHTGNLIFKTFLELKNLQFADIHTADFYLELKSVDHRRRFRIKSLDNNFSGESFPNMEFYQTINQNLSLRVEKTSRE